MTPRRWSSLTFAATALLVGLLALAPLVTTSTCAASSSGATSCTTGHTTLVANEGASVLAVLAVPLLLAALPVAVPSRRARLLSAALLTFACVVAAASIGVLLLPAVVLAWTAAGVGRQDGLTATRR